MPWLMNFQPKTGVGRFDMLLLGSDLFVRMKLHIGRGLAHDEQETWKARFEQLVKAHWEGKYGFRKGGTTLRPQFTIEYTDDMYAAHFVMNVVPGPGGSESISRDVYYKVKGGEGFLPTVANLAEGSVAVTDSSGLTMSGLQNTFPFYVDTPGGVLSPYSNEQLRMLARMLKQVDPRAKVEVTGYGGSSALSQNLVKGKLELYGLTNVTIRKSKRYFSKSKNPHSGKTEYVKVRMAAGLGMVDATTAPLFSYPAAAVHEFGHMLGLQDEYMCMSKSCADKLAELDFIESSEQTFYEGYQTATASPVSDRPGAGQVEFILYCKEANVVPPHFGRHTVSIMSSGSKFLPCHFVTVWAALQELTRLDEGAWEIVKLE